MSGERYRSHLLRWVAHVEFLFINCIYKNEPSSSVIMGLNVFSQFALRLSYCLNLILKTIRQIRFLISRNFPSTKKGNPSDITNYRPISVLYNFFKLLEISSFTVQYRKSHLSSKLVLLLKNHV